MPVSVEDLDGLEAVVLTGHGLRVVVLPALGAKIISVTDPRSGRELVWRDPHRPLRVIVPGSAYGDNDASGIDDCFPTVDACRLPGGMSVEDHGTVWSRSWRWMPQGDAVAFEIEDETIPFRLRRELSIDESRLRLDYELTNVGDVSFAYQWTGHPLLRAEEGAEIVLPPDIQARTGFGTGGRVDLNRHAWSWPELPLAGGGSGDAARVPPTSTAVNEKYWLDAPSGGCRLHYPSGDELVIDYDRAALPWLAVCVDYGGWPDVDPGYWIAIEPSTSPLDSLAESWAAGHARELEPEERHTWWWSLAVEVGRAYPGEGSG